MRFERTEKSKLADAELVAAALAGDHRAFEILIERHSGGLRRLLFLRLRSQPLADDVAQDAFLEAWQRLEKLRKPASFGAWLRQIGRNLGAEANRKRGNDQRRAAALLEAGHLTDMDFGHTPDDALQHRIRRDRVIREIRKLPEKYAEVLIMQFEDELSCHEIAERLHTSRAAVHQRLSRGRKMLDERLPNKDELAMATLVAPNALGQPSDSFAESVMRAVRNMPRSTGKAERPSAVAMPGGARRLRGWGLLSGLTVATAALVAFIQALVSALLVLHGMLDLLDPSADEQSPRRSESSASSARLPGASRPPGKAPEAAGEPGQAAIAADDEGAGPDYVVLSESTHVGSALFGEHDLEPMDDYGAQLYEAVSKAFVMHFALCLRSDVVGLEDPSPIAVELKFWLQPRSELGPHVLGNSAEERIVTGKLAGLQLSKLQVFEASRCLEDAFHKTHYPAPADGRPRLIRHHIAIDFDAIQGTLDELFAAVP